MASLRKQGNKYYVYYYNPFIKDEKGRRKQQYESFQNHEEAKMRKDEIDQNIETLKYEQDGRMTVNDYFSLKFVPLYASNRWKQKTWDTNMSYWKNDLLPFFGNKPLCSVRSIDIEQFLIVMRKKKVRNRRNIAQKDRPFLSGTTIGYVYKLLRCFLKKAVQWGDIKKSPALSDMPQSDPALREIWQPEQISFVIKHIEDDMLALAVHLAFRCTFRIGELCALTWEDINWEAKTISINKTLERVTLESLNNIHSRKALKVYEPIKKNSQTRLIVTTPKSKGGTRVVSVSDKLIEDLLLYKKSISYSESSHYSKYVDNSLVFCNKNGRPIGPNSLSTMFRKWQQNHAFEGIHKVDFHSLRISSASLKLAASHGDIKAVQKDLGDKSTHMVLTTYARCLSTQYKNMNDNFDRIFYSNQNAHNMNTRNNCHNDE